MGVKTNAKKDAVGNCWKNPKKSLTKGVTAAPKLGAIGNSIIVSHSKGTLMWQVIATNGKRERHVVTSRWEKANQLARRALELGWKVRIKTAFADIIVANTDGDFLIVATKIRAQDAARFSVEWIANAKSYSGGCLIWPHGKPVPPGWKFIQMDHQKGTKARTMRA